MMRAMLCAVLVAFSVATWALDRPGSESSRHEPGWKTYVEELEKEGYSTDSDSLEKILFADDEAVGHRWLALKILELRESNQEAVFQRVLLHDQSRRLQETASVALARRGRKDGLAALQEFFESAEDDKRKLYLASRLAEFGDSRGYLFVTEMARAENPTIRLLSLGALAQFLSPELERPESTPGPVQLFHELSRDAEVEIRREVVTQMTLATYRGVDKTELRPILERMAREDTSAEVREFARNAIAAWEFLDEEKTGEADG